MKGDKMRAQKSFIFVLLGIFVCLLVFGSDVEIVDNPKVPLPEKGKRKRLVFNEELTIGVAEGAEDYMFGNTVFVTADDQGCCYVLDWDQKRIQKYDPEGKYLLSIGGKGQGPGEFMNVWSPRFDEDGHIYATDIVNHRVSFFDKDGKFQRQIKIPDGVGGITILSSGNYFTDKSIRKEEKGTSTVVIVHGVYDKEYNLLAEVHRDVLEFKPRGNKSRAEFLADIMSRGILKPSFTSYVVENALIYTSYPDTYEIRVYSQEGEIQKIIRREFDYIKVSKQHKEYAFNRSADELLRSSPLRSLKDEVRKHMKYPKHLPAYVRFTLMDNGWIFVIVEVVRDKALIDLFNEKGVYIGQFETEIPTTSLLFKNGKAYAVAAVNGYKFVKRYGFEIQEY
jgi:hypothetical protein